MEYQSIWNLLDNATNGSSKFRTRNWIEISMAVIKLNLKIQQ